MTSETTLAVKLGNRLAKKNYAMTDLANGPDHGIRVMHNADILASRLNVANTPEMIIASMLHDVAKDGTPNHAERSADKAMELLTSEIVSEGEQPINIQQVGQIIRSHHMQTGDTQTYDISCAIISDANIMDYMSSLGIRKFMQDKKYFPDKAAHELTGLYRKLRSEPAKALVRLDLITIDNLVGNRIIPNLREPEVMMLSEMRFSSQYGDYVMSLFVSSLDAKEYMVLHKPGEMTNGKIDGRPAAVRLHTECVPSEVFYVMSCNCKNELRAAMKIIEGYGKGAIVYQRHTPENMSDEFSSRLLTERGPIPEAYLDTSAKMLKKLGYNKVILLSASQEKADGLASKGIDVVDRISLDSKEVADYEEILDFSYSGIKNERVK